MHFPTTLAAAKTLLTSLHTNTLTQQDKNLLAGILVTFIDDEVSTACIELNMKELDEAAYDYVLSGKVADELKAFYKAL